MSQLLILGASRGIGLATLREALARGHRVRAFARSAAAIAVEHPNLEKRVGDALKESHVRAVLEGVDAVVQTLGVAPGPGFVFGPVTLFSRSTGILVPAMQQTGVRRLISVTGYGAGKSHASVGFLEGIPFKLIFQRAYDDKSRQEAIIGGSDLDWTIVRPGILTNGPKIGRIRALTEPALWRNGFISRADVADFLIDEVESGRYLRQTPVIVR